MKEKIVAVFDKKTKEILACIPISGTDSICRKDVGFKIFSDSEPIFNETEDGILLKENSFLIMVKR